MRRLTLLDTTLPRMSSNPRNHGGSRKVRLWSLALVACLGAVGAGLAGCGDDDDDDGATAVDIGPVESEPDACDPIVAALKARADSSECSMQVLTLPVFECPTTIHGMAKTPADCQQYQVKSVTACLDSIPTLACGSLAKACTLVSVANGKGCP